MIRPIARKHNQETDESTNINITMEAGGKMAPKRGGKSWSKVVIHRLVRLVQMIIVIAAVNVPLYMLLLFKDWNDQLSEK